VSSASLADYDKKTLVEESLLGNTTANAKPHHANWHFNPMLDQMTHLDLQI